MDKNITGATFKILAVDDDPDCLALVAHATKNFQETKFFGAKDSKKFLNEFKLILPNLCLIDLNLDKKGEGFVLIRAIRKINPEIPLIVMSAQSDGESIAHALEMGATDFIIKPVSIKLLQKKLKSYTSSQTTNTADDLVSIPSGGWPAFLSVQYEIDSIDEMGINVIGNSLLSKGTTMYVSSEIFSPILGVSRLLVRVSSSWVCADGVHFGAYLELEGNLKEEMMSLVAKWLHTKLKGQ